MLYLIYKPHLKAVLLCVKYNANQQECQLLSLKPHKINYNNVYPAGLYLCPPAYLNTVRYK